LAHGGPSDDGDLSALKDSLQEWALREPIQALAFAKKSLPATRAFAVRAVLEVLGRFPAIAVAEGTQLFREEPDRADEYGTVLIGSLCRAGEFTSAFGLASTPGTESSREEWMAIVIGSCARNQPDTAGELATVLESQGVHGRLFQTLIDGWAASAPGTLADYALRLPAGDERTAALRLSVESWIRREPTGAAEWIASQLKDAPEFDYALATLLTKTDSVFCPTQTAFEWAGGINDPALRLNVRTNIIKTWASHDSASAKNYIQNGAALDPKERASLLAATARPADSDELSL
jgi:hypothetical protein